MSCVPIRAPWRRSVPFTVERDSWIARSTDSAIQVDRQPVLRGGGDPAVTSVDPAADSAPDTVTLAFEGGVAEIDGSARRHLVQGHRRLRPSEAWKWPFRRFSCPPMAAPTKRTEPTACERAVQHHAAGGREDVGIHRQSRLGRPSPWSPRGRVEPELRGAHVQLARHRRSSPPRDVFACKRWASRRLPPARMPASSEALADGVDERQLAGEESAALEDHPVREPHVIQIDRTLDQGPDQTRPGRPRRPGRPPMSSASSSPETVGRRTSHASLQPLSPGSGGVTQRRPVDELRQALRSWTPSLFSSAATKSRVDARSVEDADAGHGGEAGGDLLPLAARSPPTGGCGRRGCRPRRTCPRRRCSPSRRCR